MNNNKRSIMNNFKKVGLTALAGTLAATSASAVDYAMTGGLTTTFVTQDSPTSAESVNGKGLGVATDLTFKASGELDNGFTVDYTMVVDTDGALSNTSSQMAVGMGGMGSFHINNKFGSKANGIDDVMPNAYNETWDGHSPDNPSFFGSSTTAGSVDYRIPPLEIAGATINASYTYDPSAGAAPATKGAVAATSVDGDAMTLTMDHESGVSIGGGVENLSDEQGKTLGSGTSRSTVYVKYANGPLTVGYQEAYNNVVNATGVEGADQEAEFWAIAYTAGDMSFSYGESTLMTKGVSDTAAGAEIELESIQASYTMGAMTLSASLNETSNTGGTAGQKYEETQIAVSFAF